MWQDPKSMLIKYLLLKTNTVSNSLLFKMKFVTDAGCLLIIHTYTLFYQCVNEVFHLYIN